MGNKWLSLGHQFATIFLLKFDVDISIGVKVLQFVLRICLKDVWKRFDN